MTAVEDTMLVRETRLPDFVELGSLNEGDEFETDSSSGVVKWVVRNGSAKGVAVVFEGCKTEVSIAPSLKVRVRSRKPIPIPEPAPTPEPIPVIEKAPVAPPAPPAMRIVPICLPAIEPRQTANTQPCVTLHECSFTVTLSAEQIADLKPKTATDLFCLGLYGNWTKATFYDVCRAKFPDLKCGRDYAACLRQINLYRATLRKAGKLG